jgi:pantoate--beta-alanine ligase
MRAITAPKTIFEISSELNKSNKKVGLVPTMGALHEGHLTLVKRSIEENDITIVSIFINPLQFDKAEDLDKYPRSIDDDKAKLEALGVDYLFEPSVEDFYRRKPKVTISFGHLEEILEGEFRPGHFRGVGIVVNKLLNMAQPTRAYFGLKDIQQYVLIKKMVEDLSMPIEIVGVDTVRENFGLAMSSRNQRLSQSGLQIASEIYTGLQIAREGIIQKMDVEEIKNSLVDFYSAIPKLEVEYVEILNLSDFTSIDNFVDVEEVAVCFAGYVEGVRLIDNLYLRLDAVDIEY